MFTPWGPVAGSFQHTLWPLRRASEAAILLSLAFAFVVSWYRVIIAPSLCSGALQYTVYTSITAAKIVSVKFLFRAPIFGSRLEARSKKYINTNPVSAKCKLQTADRVRNADCALGTKCTLRFHTVFFVWYVITTSLQLTERHAIAFPRSSFTIICTVVQYSLPVSWSQSFII